MVCGPLLVTIACLVISSTGARADSEYERELKQLVDRRNSAAAAAAAPINDKFRAEAEQLLRQATQSGNTEAAKRIKAAIEDAAGHPTDEMKDLHKQLVGSTWTAGNPNQMRPGLGATLTFTDTQVNPGGYLYEVDSRNTVTILFKGGDRQVMLLDKDGKQLKLTFGTSDYVYNRTSP